MQELLGINEPDYGVLLDDMIIESGDEIPLHTLIQPKIEAEIAFVMRSDLVGPGINTATATRAVEAAFPVLEVIDSRIIDWKIELADTIADNASSAKVVIGQRFLPVQQLDLPLLGMALSRDGEIVATGAGAAALGNPIRCVAWLANKLAEFGTALQEGDIVLPGALHQAIPLTSTSAIRAEFNGLGPVGVRVVAEAS